MIVLRYATLLYLAGAGTLRLGAVNDRVGERDGATLKVGLNSS
jgi:hypothetical protein